MDFSFRYTAEDHCAALPVADYIAGSVMPSGFWSVAAPAAITAAAGDARRSDTMSELSLAIYVSIDYRDEDHSCRTARSDVGSRPADPPRTAAARTAAARNGTQVRRTVVRLCRHLPLLPRRNLHRPEAKPCRHPELVRPSLEACGFDIARTTSNSSASN